MEAELCSASAWPEGAGWAAGWLGGLVASAACWLER